MLSTQQQLQTQKTSQCDAIVAARDELRTQLAARVQNYKGMKLSKDQTYITYLIKHAYLETRQHEKDECTTNLSNAQNALSDAETENTQAVNEYNTCVSDIQNATNDLDAKEQEMTNVQNSLSPLQTSLTEKIIEKSEEQAKYNAKYTKYGSNLNSAKQAHLDDLQDKIDQLTTEITELQTGQNGIDNLNEQYATLQGQKTTIETTLSDLQSAKTGLLATKTAKSTLLASRQSELNALSDCSEQQTNLDGATTEFNNAEHAKNVADASENTYYSLIDAKMTDLNQNSDDWKACLEELREIKFIMRQVQNGVLSILNS